MQIKGASFLCRLNGKREADEQFPTPKEVKEFRVFFWMLSQEQGNEIEAAEAFIMSQISRELNVLGDMPREPRAAVLAGGVGEAPDMNEDKLEVPSAVSAPAGSSSSKPEKLAWQPPKPEPAPIAIDDGLGEAFEGAFGPKPAAAPKGRRAAAPKMQAGPVKRMANSLASAWAKAKKTSDAEAAEAQLAAEGNEGEE